MLTLLFQAGAGGTVFIPEVQVPLHPRVCMCQSMQNTANDIVSPSVPPGFPIHVTTTCSPRPSCDGVNCNVGVAGAVVPSAHYVSEMTIDPCTESVHIVLKDSQNRTKFNETSHDSATYTIPGMSTSNTQLIVHIVHHNFSIDLSVSSS